MVKRQDIYRGYKDWLDEFSHRYACWANRRNQWAKAKKANKRIAKKRERRAWKNEKNNSEM